jgi:hypothetical protein
MDKVQEHNKSQGTEKFTAETSVAVSARPSGKGNLERRQSVGKWFVLDYE